MIEDHPMNEEEVVYETVKPEEVAEAVEVLQEKV